MIKKYLLTVMLIFAVTAGAWAQEKPQAKKDTTRNYQFTVESDAFLLAGQLINYGYANNSASSLIEAAKIVKQYGFDKMDASEMKKKNPTSEAPSNEGSDLHSMDVSKLLTDAKKLAAGDKTLIALAESVNKSTRATSPNGIQGERIWLGANSSTTYMATRKKGELSVYSAVPEKSYCDIDICVYDDYEDEVICDTRSNSSARVSWYCSRSQTYEVEISNESDYGTYVTVSSTRR